MSRSRPSKRDRYLWKEARRTGRRTTEQIHRREPHRPFPSWGYERPPLVATYPPRLLRPRAAQVAASHARPPYRPREAPFALHGPTPRIHGPRRRAS